MHKYGLIYPEREHYESRAEYVDALDAYADALSIARAHCRNKDYMHGKRIDAAEGAIRRVTRIEDRAALLTKQRVFDRQCVSLHQRAENSSKVLDAMKSAQRDAKQQMILFQMGRDAQSL